MAPCHSTEPGCWARTRTGWRWLHVVCIQGYTQTARPRRVQNRFQSAFRSGAPGPNCTGTRWSSVPLDRKDHSFSLSSLFLDHSNIASSSDKWGQAQKKYSSVSWASFEVFMQIHHIFECMPSLSDTSQRNYATLPVWVSSHITFFKKFFL